MRHYSLTIYNTLFMNHFQVCIVYHTVAKTKVLSRFAHRWTDDSVISIERGGNQTQETSFRFSHHNHPDHHNHLNHLNHRRHKGIIANLWQTLLFLIITAQIDSIILLSSLLTITIQTSFQSCIQSVSWVTTYK